MQSAECGVRKGHAWNLRSHPQHPLGTPHSALRILHSCPAFQPLSKKAAGFTVEASSPHDRQPVLSLGPRPGDARAAMIMIHGRNARPENILELAGHLNQSGFCYLAPAAANNTWYPYSFLAPITQNEPGISSGIATIHRLVESLVAAGLPKSRICLLGFSQGACLASTYAVRHADRFGGVFALSGGLIGPPGTKWDDPGRFDGTPVFLGCSDVDPHIPKERVDESAEVFRRMGATVTARLYPGMGHMVNEDELDFVSGVMKTLTGSGQQVG